MSCCGHTQPHDLGPDDHAPGATLTGLKVWHCWSQSDVPAACNIFILQCHLTYQKFSQIVFTSTAGHFYRQDSLELTWKWKEICIMARSDFCQSLQLHAYIINCTPLPISGFTFLKNTMQSEPWCIKLRTYGEKWDKENQRHKWWWVNYY